MSYTRYITCPLCGTEQPYSWAYMGHMGSLAFYRCRACGTDWHEPSGEE